MKYRDMAPGESWKTDGKQSPSMEYRRPLPLSIQDRLQALAVEMQDVAYVLQDDKQSATTRMAGDVLLGMKRTISEWLESMKAEETIRGFVEGRKTCE